jgi:phosphatidylserine decarboxylase
MSKPLPLPVWDRRTGKLFNEWMEDSKATYESEPRRSLKQWLESEPLYDWLLAAYQHSHRSARKIEPFIREHHIDMDEFEPVIYRSYAEFFVRRFRPDVRRFPSVPGEMGAFAEARYFGWECLTADLQFPIKGYSLSAEHILGNKELARPFIGGPVILARLSPMDYHHAHYPDDGRTLEKASLGRRLWTINWHALLNQPDILFRNERQINILQTENFGRLAFVEIGALSVGRIIQIHPLDTRFRRGEEKSVFNFGGSAIIVFGEPKTWRPSDDLLARTKEGVETFVQLGGTVGSSAAGERTGS